MKRNSFLYLMLMCMLVWCSCNNQESKTKHGKLNVVTTTTMLADLVHNIGGDSVNVQGLMGAGVDPHLYKASESDVNKLFNADIVFYNGLHLEGKLEEVFEQMHQRNIKTYAVGDDIPKDSLIESANFASNYDPHIWFDVNNWKLAAQTVTVYLSKADTANSDVFARNFIRYKQELDSLHNQIKLLVAQLKPEQRILVTAHDAFNYFGRAYGFEVFGLQGISTTSEAGVQDVQKLADFIVERKVKAIFVESSVPRRTIEALQKSVESKGGTVAIGGQLFSDSLGDMVTPEGSYIGMFRYNVSTIVNALK